MKGIPDDRFLDEPDDTSSGYRHGRYCECEDCMAEAEEQADRARDDALIFDSNE